jgi:hypothetical protein
MNWLTAAPLPMKFASRSSTPVAITTWSRRKRVELSEMTFHQFDRDLISESWRMTYPDGVYAALVGRSRSKRLGLDEGHVMRCRKHPPEIRRARLRARSRSGTNRCRVPGDAGQNGVT